MVPVGTFALEENPDRCSDIEEERRSMDRSVLYVKSRRGRSRFGSLRGLFLEFVK